MSLPQLSVLPKKLIVAPEVREIPVSKHKSSHTLFKTGFPKAGMEHAFPFIYIPLKFKLLVKVKVKSRFSASAGIVEIEQT